MQAAIKLATAVIKFRNGNVDGQSNGQKMDKRMDGIAPISKATQL